MLLRGTNNTLDALVGENTTAPCLSRRGFLKVSAAAVGALTLGPALAANRERCLTIYATNTGETGRLVYWTPSEGYIDESIQEISRIMRDRYTNKIMQIDHRLLDQLYSLQTTLRPRQPVHMLSGYRAPETNARMRRTNRRVARDSYHMRGMAVDIRMPDRSFKDLHRAALSLRSGGVGRYRSSRFVHIDSGPLRRWG